MSVIGIPQGFEARLDARTNRYYYIDHATKKTTWEDPRLTHASIWTPNRTNTLQQIKEKFPSAEDKDIRIMLLRSNFVGGEVERQLRSDGHQEVERSPTISDDEEDEGDDDLDEMFGRVNQQQPSRNSTAGISQVTTHTSGGNHRSEADDLLLMKEMAAIKEEFSSAKNDVIRDVLRSSNMNNHDARKKLKEMGYEDKATIMARVQADMNLEQERKRERERAAQREKDTNDRLAQQKSDKELQELNTEFNDLSYDLVKNTFFANDKNKDYARTVLIMEVLKSEFPEMTNLVELKELVLSLDKDLDKIRITLVQQQKNQADAEMKRQEQTLSPAKRQNGAPSRQSTKSNRATGSRDSAKPNEPDTAEDADWSATFNTPPDYRRESIAKGANQKLLLRKSIAKGPDPAMRRGPDPSLRRGPNPDLLQGHINMLPQSVQ